MKIFYHLDADGKCAGAIARRYYELNGNPDKDAPMKCIGINYNHIFPFEDIIPNETVVIVDFSLNKVEEFERLLQITENVIWIDHHKTAIDKHASVEGRLKGIRDISKAGCHLTWDYFFTNKKVPRAVELIADYDIWQFKFGDVTKYFNCGFRLYVTDPTSRQWSAWLDNEYQCVDEIYFGKICFAYEEKKNSSLMAAWSFEAEFEGYKCICCNQGLTSSQLFESKYDEKKHDIMLSFVLGKSGYSVSLYTTSEDVDCGYLCHQLGKRLQTTGGGHRKAAGFQARSFTVNNGIVEVS